MELSKFNRRRSVSRQSGFSMVETLFATVILTVGLVSLAALMSKMDLTTHESRYMSTAALLASEKLEELGALKSADPDIAILTGNSAGSLTSDESYSDGTTTISYYDEVTLSAANGTISETKVDADGEYYTIRKTPDGGPPSQDTATTPPPAEPGTVVFKRRWFIENNISGFPTQVRRITVRVEFPSGTAQPGSFQLSMVRNGQPDINP